MDGINGITGGYSISILIPLFLLNKGIQFTDEKFILVTLLSVLVFCFFNFRTKAKCFAGDVGAVSIAFIVLFVLGQLILQTKSFWYIVFLSVYGVDSVLTICHRILLHENLGKPHRKHAFLLMANELHIPHVVVAGFYSLLQLAISLGAIYIDMDKWIYTVLVLLTLSVSYILFKKKYYHLHREYLETCQQK